MILTVNNRRFRDKEVLFSTWCNQKNEALRMMGNFDESNQSNTIDIAWHLKIMLIMVELSELCV